MLDLDFSIFNPCHNTADLLINTILLPINDMNGNLTNVLALHCLINVKILPHCVFFTQKNLVS